MCRKRREGTNYLPSSILKTTARAHDKSVTPVSHGNSRFQNRGVKHGDEDSASIAIVKNIVPFVDFLLR